MKGFVLLLFALLGLAGCGGGGIAFVVLAAAAALTIRHRRPGIERA